MYLPLLLKKWRDTRCRTTNLGFGLKLYKFRIGRCLIYVLTWCFGDGGSSHQEVRASNLASSLLAYVSCVSLHMHLTIRDPCIPYCGAYLSAQRLAEMPKKIGVLRCAILLCAPHSHFTMGPVWVGMEGATRRSWFSTTLQNFRTIRSS